MYINKDITRNKGQLNGKSKLQRLGLCSLNRIANRCPYI